MTGRVTKAVDFVGAVFGSKQIPSCTIRAHLAGRGATESRGRSKFLRLQGSQGQATSDRRWCSLAIAHGTQLHEIVERGEVPDSDDVD